MPRTRGRLPTLLLLAVALVVMTAAPVGAESIKGGIDMEMVKTVDRAQASPGDELVYTLVATNHGEMGARNGFVTDTLPAGVEFVAVDDTTRCSYDAAGHAVECDLGRWLQQPLTLALVPMADTGYQVTFTITGRIADDATGLLHNVARVENRDPNVPATMPPDGNPANNEDFADTEVVLGSIGDTVFEDTNGNGVQDAGEPGIPGVTVTLTGPAGTATTTTGPGGGYGFADLAPGAYAVAVDVTTAPGGHALTTPGSFDVTLAGGQSYVDADFGFEPPPPPPASLGDTVFEDTNGNGVQDVGEPGIAGVTVTLDGPGGPITTKTGSDGAYSFTGLAAGAYAVSVDVASAPAGYTLTTPGSFDVTLAAGETNLDADFGMKPAPQMIDLEVTKAANPAAVTVGEEATFTITVLNRGPDEATGVVLTDAVPAGLTVLSTAGDGVYAGGAWTVGSLAAGASASLTMTVSVGAAGQFTNSVEVTAADQDDVDSTPGDGQGDDFALAEVAGTAVLATASLGDTVFLDLDADGVRDAGESGIAGVEVTLTGPAGTSTTTTDADGKYLFAALEAGTYTVTVGSAGDDLDLTTVGAFTVPLAEGDAFLGADFGFTEVLPKTGIAAGELALVAVLLLGSGLLLLLGVRRRES